MRIDYSEPRQSYRPAEHDTYSGGGRYREEKSSSPRFLLLLIVLGIGFIGGFCVGWYFSQQAAKRSFRAAMEQQSLESNKDLKQPQQGQQAPPANSPASSQFQVGQQVPPAGTAPSAVPGGSAVKPGQQPVTAAPAGQVPLSFFENLPKGQKQTVLGSGINEKPKPTQQAPVQSSVTPTGATPKSADKTSGGGYLVQVASFASQKEAESTRAKLSAKGYSASISEVKLADKGTWYRVRIGRHLDKEAATEIATRISGGAKIVPDQEQ